MPKNYYIYFFNGKIKRQAINLNDIYPESYASRKIPAGADIIAKIVTSDVKNHSGYMVKYLESTWLKHCSWTDYYMENNLYLTVEFKDAKKYHDNQALFVNKYLPMLTENERVLLSESTKKVMSRLWV
jgi:hypothetical protein